MNLTYYQILGVDPDAAVQDIKVAYHKKLLSSHPDKIGNTTTGTSVSLLKEAYRVLSGSDRKQYDEELKTSFKKQGFNITGAGLDVYTLESFDMDDLGTLWFRDCPRCASVNSIELRESDLDMGTPDGLGGYQIMAPCQSCSLWITVLYEEEEDEKEE